MNIRVPSRRSALRAQVGLLGIRDVEDRVLHFVASIVGASGRPRKRVIAIVVAALSYSTDAHAARSVE